MVTLGKEGKEEKKNHEGNNMVIASQRTEVQVYSVPTVNLSTYRLGHFECYKLTGCGTLTHLLYLHDLGIYV